MSLPRILTDKEVLGSHIQEVRKMGERARMEGKVYELCTGIAIWMNTLRHSAFTRHL